MSDQFTDFDVAKRLGDTVQTLHNTYAHWFKQRDKSIIDFMDGRVAEAQPAQRNKIAELKELKELLNDGILSAQEFAELKKDILKR